MVQRLDARSAGHSSSYSLARSLCVREEGSVAERDPVTHSLGACGTGQSVECAIVEPIEGEEHEESHDDDGEWPSPCA